MFKDTKNLELNHEEVNNLLKSFRTNPQENTANALQLRADENNLKKMLIKELSKQGTWGQIRSEFLDDILNPFVRILRIAIETELKKENGDPIAAIQDCCRGFVKRFST